MTKEEIGDDQVYLINIRNELEDIEEMTKEEIVDDQVYLINIRNELKAIKKDAKRFFPI